MVDLPSLYHFGCKTGDACLKFKSFANPLASWVPLIRGFLISLYCEHRRCAMCCLVRSVHTCSHHLLCLSTQPYHSIIRLFHAPQVCICNLSHDSGLRLDSRDFRRCLQSTTSKSWACKVQVLAAELLGWNWALLCQRLAAQQFKLWTWSAAWRDGGGL